MNRDINVTSGGAPFEYVVAKAKTPTLYFQRITLISLYVLWGVGLFLVGAATRLLVYFLALVPLSLWVLVFFTWRLTQVEYEYSFFSGELTVSRLLGGRTRRELCCVQIKGLSRVLPYEDEYAAQIESFSADKVIFAASGEDSPSLYVALWSDADTRYALVIEANEKALRILRYHNASAVTLRPSDR